MLRKLLVLAATALLATADVCPVLDTKTGLRKTVVGGKTVTLTIKITNRDLAITNGGLMLDLPSGVTYKSVSVSPKLSPAPTFQQEGSLVAWTGINMPVKKTRTFRVKLAFDKCAGEDEVLKNGKAISNLYSTSISVETFTGTVISPSCSNTKTVTVNVRRPKTATDCAPPMPAVLCGTPISSNFYVCADSIENPTGPGNYDRCGQANTAPTVTGSDDCIQQCGQAGAALVKYRTNDNYCGCYNTLPNPAELKNGNPQNPTMIGVFDNPWNPTVSGTCD